MQGLSSHEKLVWLILNQNKETRGSDKKLLLAVWEYQGFKLTDAQKRAFMQCLPAETVLKDKRLIQEKGFFRNISTQLEIGGEA